jgi:hypothetical protein
MGREGCLDDGVNDCGQSRVADDGVMAAKITTGGEVQGQTGHGDRRPRKAGRRTMVSAGGGGWVCSGVLRCDTLERLFNEMVVGRCDLPNVLLARRRTMFYRKSWVRSGSSDDG